MFIIHIFNVGLAPVKKSQTLTLLTKPHHGGLLPVVPSSSLTSYVSWKAWVDEKDSPPPPRAARAKRILRHLHFQKGSTPSFSFEEYQCWFGKHYCYCCFCKKMNEWKTCQNSPSPHERGVWTWCRSRWGRVGGSPRRSPPCLQSPWVLGMRICTKAESQVIKE